MKLQAVVVERGGRIHDLPAQLLELQRIMADEIGLEAGDRLLGRLAAAAELAEASQPLVGLHLDDGRTERPQCAPFGVPQRRLERDGHRRRLQVGDLHGSSLPICA